MTPDSVKVEEEDRLHDALIIVLISLLSLQGNVQYASKCEEDNEELDDYVLEVCNRSNSKLLNECKLLEQLICKIEVNTEVHHDCKDCYFLLLELALVIDSIPIHIVNHGVVSWSVVDHMPTYCCKNIQEILEHLF